VKCHLHGADQSEGVAAMGVGIPERSSVGKVSDCPFRHVQIMGFVRFGSGDGGSGDLGAVASCWYATIRLAFFI